jgi:hypothetical protein
MTSERWPPGVTRNVTVTPSSVADHHIASIDVEGRRDA